MEIIEPGYYREFRCLAADCPDSCCKEWSVEVDAGTAAAYRALPGPLGDRLRAAMVQEDGVTVFRQEAGRCPMWRPDGLCELQARLGEQALCEVCATYPRMRHDYGDFVEMGLEMSCPEAARLILSARPGDVSTREAPGGAAPAYDMALMAILRRTRGEFLAFLDSGDYPIRQTLAVLLLYGCQVQAEIDGGEKAGLDPERVLEAAGRLASQGEMQGILDFFAGLEVLNKAWRDRLCAPGNTGHWPETMRALARYGICRYWYQAVCDYDLLCRIKLVILSCLVVNTLGGDPVQTAQQYSKEIENDPDNVEAVLSGCYSDPALSDINLLGLLLPRT